jgi:hypothetical protein
MGSVWIAGGYQSDFARNYAREGLEISSRLNMYGHMNVAGSSSGTARSRSTPAAA